MIPYLICEYLYHSSRALPRLRSNNNDIMLADSLCPPSQFHTFPHSNLGSLPWQSEDPNRLYHLMVLNVLFLTITLCIHCKSHRSDRSVHHRKGRQRWLCWILRPYHIRYSRTACHFSQNSGGYSCYNIKGSHQTLLRQRRNGSFVSNGSLDRPTVLFVSERFNRCPPQLMPPLWN